MLGTKKLAASSLINHSDTKKLNNNPELNVYNGDKLVSEYLYPQLDKDNKILTHGYVHGHIHKHKDHTHIHGHIHNHDHDHDQHSTSSADGITNSAYDESCRELDEFLVCKDIFCNELDDCFFLNCDDTKISHCDTTCNNSCPDSLCTQDESDYCDGRNCEELVNKGSECCRNSDCFDESVCHLSSSAECNGQICDNDPPPTCCNPANHENNLCNLQLPKKPIFEDLIDNVQRNFKEQENEELAIKKRRLNNDKAFEIHFPHECHPQHEISDSSIINESNSNHYFHQSCFHTSIPNSSSSANSKSDQLLSDFDFYIQFNNFSQFLNNSCGPTDNILKQCTKADSEIGLLHSSQSDNQNILSLQSDSYQPSYICQWDNCLRKVNDSTFMEHLINQHIDQEYGLDKTAIADTQFQCEWNDCNYMDRTLDSFIDHLDSHKGTQPQQLPTLQSQNSILTPSSTSKSSISSPIGTDLPTSATNNINITSMKILPKKTNCCTNSLHDPEFTCHWQVGLDSSGNPIHCSKTHDSAGCLQHHLINDHIGSGRSIYHCNWVGCERHNGKVFTQRQKLLRHIHIHTNFKPCKCEICGSTFAVDAMLKQHMRTHSGEKPFSCSICGKKFATSSSLSIHNRVHTGEKPLICKWPGCNKRFSESSNLTKHMKIHLKTFKCDICGLEFDKKPNYTKHMKMHKLESNDDNNGNIETM